MATSDLYVPGATQNPIKTPHLPKSRPRAQFPLDIKAGEQPRAHALKILFYMLICSAACLFYTRAPSHPTPAIVLGIMCVTAAAIAYQVFRAILYGDSDWPYVSCIPFALFIVIVLRAISIPLLVLVTIGFLALEGWLLPTHYLSWSAAGFMSRKRARRFMLFNKLPEGVKPGSLLRGIHDAIVYYLGYNHQRLEVPGAWKSLAGGYDARLARTFALILLLTWTLAHAMRPPIEIGGETLPTMTAFYFVAIPIVTVGVWLLSMALFAASTARDADGLQKHRFSPEFWPEFVEERNSSKDPVERDSMFLGTVDYDGSPILNPLSQLMKHAWIVGKTGSGKTTFLLSLIDQIARRGDTSIDYLDLKATSFEPYAALLGGCPGTSHPPVRDVKRFTLEQGQGSYLFDLFSQQAWKNLPSAQRAALVLSALSLAHSASYGQSWYRDAAYDVVFYVLDRHPDIKSWREFAKRIQDAVRHAKPWELPDDVKHDGVHVQLIVKRLAALSALNADESIAKAVRENAIDLTDGFRSPQYNYFALSASINGLIAGEIGRLVATSLLVTAATMKERPIKRILIIDEWQCMVTNQLTILLEQARSLGIGVILANQTTAQLITPDGDLRPIVEGNTSLQAWLQITDDIGREQLRRLGGQNIEILTSKSVNREGEASHTYSQYIADRIPTTLSSTVGSENQRYFLRLTDNAGYACYGDLIFVARSHFHQQKDDYEAYCEMKWPSATEKTLINTEAPRTEPPTPPTAEAPVPAPKPPGSDPSKQNAAKTNQLGRPRPKKNTPKTTSP